MEILQFTTLKLLLIVFVKAHTWNYMEIALCLQQYYHSNSINFIVHQLEDLELTQTAVRLHRKVAEKYMQIVVSKGKQQSSCQHYRALQIISYAKHSYMYSALAHQNLSKSIWLVFLDKNIELQEFIGDINIPFDCEFLVAQPEDQHFVLTEVYRISPKLPLQSHRFGTWTSITGLAGPSIGFYRRRNNLSGVALRTAITMDFPMLNSARGLENKDFFISVCLALQRRMNFTAEFVKPSIRGHGVKTDDESWNGILGMMQRGEASLACVDLSFQPSRIQVVDFISVMQDDRHIMFIKQPQIFQLYWKNFLYPFRYDVWIMIFMTGLLLSLVLWISVRSRFVEDCKLSDSILFTFGRFCQQGQQMPQYTSGRLVTTVTCLTAAVILAGYSAFLISDLTQRSPALPFTNFEEFLHDGTYQIGLDPASSIMDFFQTCSDPTLKRIYKEYLEPNKEVLPRTNYEGLQEVCKRDNYAYVYSFMNVDKYSNKITCELITVPQAFIPRLKGMALDKGSPYLGIFRHNIHAMTRVGVLRKLQTQSSRYSQDVQSSTIAIDISAVLPIFVILLVGNLLSTVIIILEIICKRKRKHIS